MILTRFLCMDQSTAPAFSGDVMGDKPKFHPADTAHPSSVVD